MKQVFNEDQIRAIEMLAQGGYNYVDIAERCNVHVDTLRNWRKDEDFQLEVRKRARELLREAEPFLYRSALDAVGNKERAYQYQYIKLLLDRIERLDAIADGRGDQYEVMFTWKGQAQVGDGAESERPELPGPDAESYADSTLRSEAEGRTQQGVTGEETPG